MKIEAGSEGPRDGCRTVMGLLAVLAFLSVPAGAAELYARRMEIVQTPNGQETVFRDSVTIVDGTTLIRAQVARFNESRGVAVVSESVDISSPDAHVLADSAVYLLDARVTELFGAVRIEMDSLTITAPHLFYRVSERRVDADNGLVIRTRNDGLRLRGARGRYDMDRKEGEVDSLPVLVLGGEDSVIATSRTMTWQGNGATALLSGDVRVGTRSAGLSADTLLYWTRPDTGVAWGSPRVSDSTGNTEGDTIRLAVVDGALRRVEVTGNAKGHYATSGASVVDVAGEVIRVLLENGELAVIEVEHLTRGWLVESGMVEPSNDGSEGPRS